MNALKIPKSAKQTDLPDGNVVLSWRGRAIFENKVSECFFAVMRGPLIVKENEEDAIREASRASRDGNDADGG